MIAQHPRMAAGLAAHPLVGAAPPLCGSPLGLGAASRCPSRSRRPRRVAVTALGDPPKKKKFITREEEPEEYWQSKAEREGESPFRDPLAYIGLLTIVVPFAILGIAVATGYVDLNP